MASGMMPGLLPNWSRWQHVRWHYRIEQVHRLTVNAHNLSNHVEHVPADGIVARGEVCHRQGVANPTWCPHVSHMRPCGWCAGWLHGMDWWT